LIWLQMARDSLLTGLKANFSSWGGSSFQLSILSLCSDMGRLLFASK
jgi:hypothetical protein